MLDVILNFIDWRFAVGLLVGFVLTFRYVVIGYYHPIIRELEASRRNGE